jgi:hypothetical protein
MADPHVWQSNQHSNDYGVTSEGQPMNYKESSSLKPDLLPTPAALQEVVTAVPPPPRAPYAPKRASPPVDLAGLEDALRSPLAGLAHQIAALTFNETMEMCTGITDREGYKPPEKTHELAALVNDWAMAQMKTPPR